MLAIVTYTLLLIARLGQDTGAQTVYLRNATISGRMMYLFVALFELGEYSHSSMNSTQQLKLICDDVNL